MLALARALAVSPKLIIADEMSLGLAPLMAESVFEGLEEARRSGITIVLSEQFVHRALSMADSCVILTRGRVGWSGPASEAGQEVIDRYLGEAEHATANWQVGGGIVTERSVQFRCGTGATRIWRRAHLRWSDSQRRSPTRVAHPSWSRHKAHSHWRKNARTPDDEQGPVWPPVVVLPTRHGRCRIGDDGGGIAGADHHRVHHRPHRPGRVPERQRHRPGSTPASPCRTPKAA